MKHHARVAFLFAAVSVSVSFASSGPAPGEAVPDKVALEAVPFPLEAVRLLDGPFKQAMQLDAQYLLSLDADRLLHNFRVTAGLYFTRRLPSKPLEPSAPD